MLRNTAGSPQLLGRDFDEAAELIDKAGGPSAWASASTSLPPDARPATTSRTPKGNEGPGRTRSTRRSAWKQLKLLHVNDATDPLGSNRDRHAPIGKGEIGRKGFRAFSGELSPAGPARPSWRDPASTGTTVREEGRPDHPPPAPRGGPEPQLMLLNRRTLDGIATGRDRPCLPALESARPSGPGHPAHQRWTARHRRKSNPSASGRSTGSRPAVPGSQSRRELIESLRPRGRLFRIRLHRIWRRSPCRTPRAGPGSQHPSGAELEARLGRMDRARGEPWTQRILELIRDRSRDARRGPRRLDPAWRRPRSERDVRRLKELGPTESLPVGYRLSPRGGPTSADRPIGLPR